MRLIWFRELLISMRLKKQLPIQLY